MNQELTQKKTSIAAVLAAIFTFVSLPGLLCCAPAGCGTAFFGMALGGFAVFEFHTGKTDQLSGVIAWVSLVMSTGVVVLTFVFFGIAGLSGAMQEHGVDLPTEYRSGAKPAQPSSP